MIKVHVLQVNQDPANIAELTAGVVAGRTVDDWQMPKGSQPGDLVIWYAVGHQKYIAREWVDAIATEVREGPGPYRGPVVGMDWIEPVDRRKVITDRGIDGGVGSLPDGGRQVRGGLSKLTRAFTPDPALEARANLSELSPGHAADWHLRQLRLKFGSTARDGPDKDLWQREYLLTTPGRLLLFCRDPLSDKRAKWSRAAIASPKSPVQTDEARQASQRVGCA